MLEAIRKRRSIRAYQNREVGEEKLRDMLKAAMCAPTSWGTRAWEFIVVRDAGTRKLLSEATPYAYFVKEAPVAIVICYDIKTGKRFKEDASICAEHILLEAVNQGLGGCFVQVADAQGPHGDAEPYVKGLLDVPEGFRVQCMIPVGYPAKEPPPHTEDEFEESKVHHERF